MQKNIIIEEPNATQINGAKLVLDYPLEWEYAAIGFSESEVKKAIETICQNLNAQHKITKIKPSKNGKFQSVHFSAKVDSQSQRDEIFAQLKQSPAVVMVL